MKLILAAVAGLAAGVSIAPFEHKTVLASTTRANAHFQMLEATVDESNAEGQDIPSHEVFLLDTEGGTVWRFQGLQIGRDKDGTTGILAEPVFLPITVQQPK